MVFGDGNDGRVDESKIEGSEVSDVMVMEDVG